MIDKNKVVSIIIDKLNNMPEDERREYLKKMGFKVNVCGRKDLIVRSVPKREYNFSSSNYCNNGRSKCVRYKRMQRILFAKQGHKKNMLKRG